MRLAHGSLPRMLFIAVTTAFVLHCGGGGGGSPNDPPPPPPPLNTTFFTYASPLGDYAIYLPPGVSKYRGVVFIAPGLTQNTRLIVDRSLDLPGDFIDFDDPAFQAYRTRLLALAQKHGLAVLGAKLDPVNHQALDKLDNFRAAMAKLALDSQHPELATAPFLFDGSSAGGCFVYAFTRRYPDRVIGFWTQKGGCHDIRDGGAAKQVPGFLLIGGADLQNRCLNLTQLFESNRPLGALWALAVQPGADHAPLLNHDLLFHWMDTILASRLPAAGEPVALRPISESSGWLGDRETGSVAQFADYNKDATQASWLPSPQVAAAWSALVSPGRQLSCPEDPPDTAVPPNME
jgi:hypothetical protein